MPSPAPLLRLQGITKSFGGLLANDAIDLDVGAGEIVALLGENGAGKTTLMNILFGHYVADAGEVAVAGTGEAAIAQIDGEVAIAGTSEAAITDARRFPGKWKPIFRERARAGKGAAPFRASPRMQDAPSGARPAIPLPPGSPQAALAAGIGMVHQHFTLAHNLTGLENIMLGTVPVFGLALPRRAARARLQRLMAETGLHVALDARVDALSVGERQRVEILKALYRRARVLVLDEPTAVLTPPDAEQLFVAIRSLAARGLAVIFISHKLGEVLALAQRIVILRQGRKVADLPAEGATREMLARHMIGRPLEAPHPTRAHAGGAVLELDGVTSGEGRDRLIDASLVVRAGEIVGIAGVSGNGQRGLAGLVSGLEQARSGRVLVLGALAVGGPRAMIARGVGRLTEDRHHDGIVSDLSVAENLILERTRSPAVQRHGLLRHRAIRREAEAAISAFDIRGPGPGAPIRLLSGGNIQKLLLARALHGGPRLILANQPTRGLDIGATGEVHRRLQQAAADGAGVLLISEDLDELLALAHRIAVLHTGRLTPAMERNAVDMAAIGLAMAGQRAGAFAAPPAPMTAERIGAGVP